MALMEQNRSSVNRFTWVQVRTDANWWKQRHLFDRSAVWRKTKTELQKRPGSAARSEHYSKGSLVSGVSALSGNKCWNKRWYQNRSARFRRMNRVVNELLICVRVHMSYTQSVRCPVTQNHTGRLCSRWFPSCPRPTWTSPVSECRIADRGGGWGRTKSSFFASGEEFQSLLEVLDGRADVLVLQSTARVLTELLGPGEVLRGKLDAAWRGRRRSGINLTNLIWLDRAMLKKLWIKTYNQLKMKL